VTGCYDTKFCIHLLPTNLRTKCELCTCTRYRSRKTYNFRPTEMSNILLGSQTMVNLVTRIHGEIMLCLQTQIINLMKRIKSQRTWEQYFHLYCLFKYNKWPNINLDIALSKILTAKNATEQKSLAPSRTRLNVDGKIRRRKQK
jgi:hypothetical protein